MGDKVVLEFVSKAREWPLGGQLAAAGSAANPKKGLGAVKHIMKNEGLSDADIEKYAEEIHGFVKDFIKNTGFSVSFERPYWSDEFVSSWQDPCEGINQALASGPFKCGARIACCFSKGFMLG